MLCCARSVLVSMFLVPRYGLQGCERYRETGNSVYTPVYNPVHSSLDAICSSSLYQLSVLDLQLSNSAPDDGTQKTQPLTAPAERGEECSTDRSALPRDVVCVNE